MLGWHVYIHRSPGGMSEDLAVKKASVVASWEVGLGGIDWLQTLERQGKAVCTKRNGYPTTFVASAAVVRAAIAGGPPTDARDPLVIGDDYVAPPGWTANVMIDTEQLAACDPREQFVIDAWDLS